MSNTRELLIDAMETRFATIWVSNGYRTDIGHSIRPWQSSPPLWEDLPILTVKDPTDAPEPAFYDNLLHQLIAQIEIVLPGTTSAANLRDYAADVLQAIGVDPTWGDLARSTRLDAIEIEVGDEDSVGPGVTITVAIQYESAQWTL